MEYVDGESLDSVIRRSGPLSPATALKVMSFVVDGLGAIHEQHLVHRDIKPANIMVKLQGDKVVNAKIIDLGLAKSMVEDGSRSEISGHGVFAGTPRYASPEQFAGLGIDIRSDLYSLGVTLWEMLSNSAPFEGSAPELMGQHQHSKPPFAKLTGVPKPVVSLLDVLLHSLCLAMDDRDWSKAEDLLAQLKPSKEAASFTYTSTRIPIGCFALLLARLQGKTPGTEFDGAREQLAKSVQTAPNDASLLSELAVTDALLNRTQDALKEARMAVEMMPVSKDALDGPRLVINQAVVFAWTGQPDLAIDTLTLSVKTPNGIVYGELKVDPLWDPIRQDPRFEKLQAHLAPKN